MYFIVEAGRDAEAQGVTVKSTDCGLVPQSRKWNIYLHLYFHFFALVSRHSAALSSTSQHAMPPEFGGKWGTECLNTRFPLPTLLCAGYSVKLFFLLYSYTITQFYKILLKLFIFCTTILIFYFNIHNLIINIPII